MIRNIVFDMGMVLMNFDPHRACMTFARDEQKAEVLKAAVFGHPDWPKKIDGGLVDDEEYLLEVQQRLETDELKQMAEGVVLGWWKNGGLTPKPGMADVVKTLHGQGFHLYILSNCGFCFRKLQHTIPGIELFEGCLVSAEEQLRKPDKAIFRRFCERFEVQAEECFFIDDLPGNAEGAIRSGMQAYCFADGDVERLQAELKKLA